MESKTILNPQFPVLIFPAKRIRAKVIHDYCEEAGIRGCVCCSCGNASKALKDTGLYTVSIAPNGDLKANRWFKPQEIARMFPGLLDATSGHLPLPLMERLGNAYSTFIANQPNQIFWMHREYYLPTGSGETLLALRLAFSGIKFHPLRWKNNPATEFNHENFLNHGLQLMNVLTVEERQMNLNILEIR